MVPVSVTRGMSASVIDTIADEGGKLDEVMDAIDAAVREADPSATPTPQSLKSALAGRRAIQLRMASAFFLCRGVIPPVSCRC